MGNKILLISDLHLTDNPLEDYRWRVFSQACALCDEHKVREVFILGDMWDRKDRHSATLLNRTVQELGTLIALTGVKIRILMGNHDAPIAGTPYWDFLNSLGFRYVTTPYFDPDYEIWLLPFSPNPAEEWKEFPFQRSKALFMHQTVAGAAIEGSRKIEKAPNPMPIFPRGIPIYSGDVHRPQTVGSVTYIGTPYPTRFGEDWDCRALLLDSDNFKAFQELPLNNLRRRIMDVKAVEELGMLLETGYVERGDQVRVRFHLNQDNFTRWATDELKVRAWAEQNSIILLSVEAVLEQTITRGEDTSVAQAENVEQLAPEDILRLFAQDSDLSDEVQARGLELVAHARGGK